MLLGVLGRLWGSLFGLAVVVFRVYICNKKKAYLGPKGREQTGGGRNVRAQLQSNGRRFRVLIFTVLAHFKL